MNNKKEMRKKRKEIRSHIYVWK